MKRVVTHVDITFHQHEPGHDMCRRQHHHDAVFVVSASGCQQRRRQQARQYATQVVTYVDVTFVSTPARLMTTSYR